ncbi:MAG: DUF6391 domain-containing protein [Synechococcales bacterium]|nr:DUF6391 domain-containing protein [Synechococcales bacterium]
MNPSTFPDLAYHSGRSPLDFSPNATQDADLLHSLGFIPGLKELLIMRQAHALEHATVWVLNESSRAPGPASLMGHPARIDDGQLSGLSTDRGFYLYGNVPTSRLRQAVQVALQRLTQGEWSLAVHPRCGTNISVSMALTAMLAVGINLVMPKGPLEQLLGIGLAVAAAEQMAPDVGSVVQQHITTAIPFNLEVTDIHPLDRRWHGPGHFIQVRWVE